MFITENVLIAQCLKTSFSLVSLRILHSGDRFKLVESHSLKSRHVMWKLCGCHVLLPELVAVPGDGELDGVAV